METRRSPATSSAKEGRPTRRCSRPRPGPRLIANAVRYPVKSLVEALPPETNPAGRKPGSELFVAQRARRIDPGGAPGGEEGRGEGSGQQGCGAHREDAQVSGLDAEELALDKFAA